MERHRKIEDSGHGWAQVRIVELRDLGIRDAISPYSYVRGHFAYLEEDLDMSVWLAARKGAGWPDPEIDTVYEGPTSQVRNYRHYESADNWAERSKAILTTVA